MERGAVETDTKKQLIVILGSIGFRKIVLEILDILKNGL